MPKFAIYYVPEATQELYHLGSAVLGYDLRRRTRVEMPPELAALSKVFDPEWVRISRLYGFHLTIGHSLHCRLSDIARINFEVQTIWSLFSPATQFVLTSATPRPVTFWGKNSEILVLEFESNKSLLILHTLLTALLTSFGTGSSYVNDLDGIRSDKKNEPDMCLKIEKFLSPNILDRYRPHFTLLNPYQGSDHVHLASIFSRIFSRFSTVEALSICLVVQKQEGEPWEIYSEFSR